MKTLSSWSAKNNKSRVSCGMRKMIMATIILNKSAQCSFFSCSCRILNVKEWKWKYPRSIIKESHILPRNTSALEKISNNMENGWFFGVLVEWYLHWYYGEHKATFKNVQICLLLLFYTIIVKYCMSSTLICLGMEKFSVFFLLAIDYL